MNDHRDSKNFGKKPAANPTQNPELDRRPIQYEFDLALRSALAHRESPPTQLTSAILRYVHKSQQRTLRIYRRLCLASLAILAPLSLLFFMVNPLKNFSLEGSSNISGNFFWKPSWDLSWTTYLDRPVQWILQWVPTFSLPSFEAPSLSTGLPLLWVGLLTVVGLVLLAWGTFLTIKWSHSPSI